MAVLGTLVTTLKFKADIEVSDDFSDAQLQALINDALLEHNPSMTMLTLPATEERLVLLLAWAEVCAIRATRFAKQADLVGNITGYGQAGFGQNMESPFTRNLKMAEFLRKQYVELGSTLGVANSSVVSSSVLRIAPEFDAQVSTTESVPPPPITLTSGDNQNDYVVLSWTMADYPNFYRYHIFTSLGVTPCIYQEWNYASTTGIPCILDGLTAAGIVDTQSVKSVKLTGIDRTDITRYLVVCESRSGKFSYSNEIDLEAITP